MKARKRFDAAFKAKVALKAIRVEPAVSGLASEPDLKIRLTSLAALDSLGCNNLGRCMMPWNEAARAKYDVIRARYSSDMSEAEFALIAPLLPPARRRGRKLTDPQAILNALFYMIRRACTWRYLPKDFLAFTTVQNRFYAWRDSGLSTQIVATLVMEAREAQGREAAPTAVVVDSPSVKTTEAGGPRSFDAGKKVKGCMRHLATAGKMTMGLSLTGATPASVM